MNLNKNFTDFISLFNKHKVKYVLVGEDGQLFLKVIQGIQEIWIYSSNEMMKTQLRY